MATIKKISGLSDAGTLTTTHRLLVEDSSGNLKSTTVGAVNNHTHTWSEVTGKPSTFTPASHTQGEATLTWGGKNFSGTYGPVDASMIPELGANRLAFGNPAGITIEYSRNGGSTWTDYGADNNSKVNLFSPPGAGFSIGKADSTNKATADYLLRVTISTSSFGVYTALNKFMIYCSTNGSTGSYCSIDAALESTPTTFVNFANKVPISGWSGYNIINTSSITTYGNSASNQYGRLRFTFGCTGGSTTYSGLNIVKIYGFGGVGWTAPSNLARTGHIYSIGTGQSVGFPGTVSAGGGFSGNLTGTASKATGDSKGQNIIETYIKGLSVNGTTITYTKGDGSTGTITTKDTTYSSKSAAEEGTDVSLVTTGEKYIWNNKANAFTVLSTNPTAAWSSPVVVGTVAGTELKFTMPASPSIEAKISSEDTSSKIFLVGATSQSSSGADTYSDDQVYATNGQLDANKVRVAEKVTLQYNSSTESLDFVFI